MSEDSGSRPMDAGPLAGVKVVELAAYLAGPFASMMLADLGAEVAKVEPPRGEPFRRFLRPSAPVSPQFANVNRNKASVLLDLKQPAGREAFAELLGGADVLLTNWRPGALARLGLDDAALAEANPRLVRCYLTGFGRDGPDADRPAFDPIIQAHASMTTTWGTDDHPEVAPNYLADSIAATMTVQAVLAALVSRAGSGKGERVEVAMLDAVSYFSYPSALAHRTFLDHTAGAGAGPNPHARPARPIAAADGWLVVSPVSKVQIEGALAAVGRPELASRLIADLDGPRLADALTAEIEKVTRTGPVERWLAAFGAHDVPAARCLSTEEHFDDPQVRHNDIYSIEEWPGLGRVRQVRYPARYTSWPRLGTRTPVRLLPELGARDAL
ncbi:MAG: CaiB/BaiF CoA transferase family protein [Acidimicrobiales bacterium]